ncbi:MAG TPA: M48 family peptidase [Candidatus Angelobacter sp.]|nr:M48 family peptidase [Candidatus Angelobacter sp.]
MTSTLSQIFEQAYRDLRPGMAAPEFEVRFYRFANINNTIRLRQGRIFVRISDLLEGAPEPVLYALLHILIAKLHRKPIDPAQATRYRRFTGSPAMAAKSHLIRQMRGRKRIEGPRGKHYDLDEVFEQLNLRFFHGLMARPQMTWSGSRSLRSLGHYDPAHNTIVVSRVFDGPRVPRYAIEYLVYHEMLHLRHPVKLRGSRRLVHPAAFREEEKLFPQLEAAKEFLKRLGSLD